MGVVDKWHENKLKLWQWHEKLQYNIVKYLLPDAYGLFFNTAFEIQMRDMHPPSPPLPPGMLPQGGILDKWLRLSKKTRQAVIA